MRNIFLIIIIFCLPFSCFAQNNTKADKEKSEIKPSKDDDGEWDINVIDTQYDYFLNSIAQPMSQYSEPYLKLRNAIMVTEWNSYFSMGKYRNIIESSISYDPKENYGLKFEYKLYQVFAYVNWKYGLKINGLSGSDAIRN